MLGVILGIRHYSEVNWMSFTFQIYMYISKMAKSRGVFWHPFPGYTGKWMSESPRESRNVMFFKIFFFLISAFLLLFWITKHVGITTWTPKSYVFQVFFFLISAFFIAFLNHETCLYLFFLRNYCFLCYLKLNFGNGTKKNIVKEIFLVHFTIFL